MTFSNYFKLDDYKQLCSLWNDDSDKADMYGKSKMMSLMEKTFDKAIIDFLIDYKKDNFLPKVAYGEGHEIYWKSQWNQMLKDKEFDKSVFSSSFFMVLAYGMPKQEATQKDIEDAYNKLIENTDRGNFGRHLVSEDFCSCTDCGQKMRLIFEGWKPKFQVLKKIEDKKIIMGNPESCLAKEVVSLNVDFPTGELLMADWFRIPGFTEAVEYKGADKYSQERSINHASGRILATKENLENFNFISISVGNSSPRIFQSGNNLAFGSVDEDKEDDIGKYKEVGYVCTDLWAVTIIDKKVLIEIIAKTNNEDIDIATELVNKYIKEESVNKVNVKPGSYQLNFHGNYYNFDKLSKDKDYPETIKKFFTIKSKDLEYTPKKPKF